MNLSGFDTEDCATAGITESAAPSTSKASAAVRERSGIELPSVGDELRQRSPAPDECRAKPMVGNRRPRVNPDRGVDLASRLAMAACHPA